MKKFFALLLVLVLTFSLVACGEKEPDPEPTPEKKVLKMGVSFPTFDNPAWVHISDMFEKWAPEYGKKNDCEVELTIVSADGDAAAQSAAITDFINGGYDVIFACAVDNKSMWSSVTEAKKAGIPFISFMRNIAEGAPDEPDATYVLDAFAYSYESNKCVMQMMLDAGYKPEEIFAIEVLGALSDQNAVLYSEGFQAAAKEFGINVVEQVASEWSVDTCLARFSPVIQAHPEVNYIQNPTDSLGAGILPALERIDRLHPLGEEGHVYIASSGGIEYGLEMVQEGIYDCTTVEDHESLVIQCYEAAFNLLNGKPAPTAALDIPAVTQANFDEMKAAGKCWAMD